jgi:hypothetical protein
MQKLSKLAAPDPFKSSSSAIKTGERKVGENKLISKPGSSKLGSKNRYQVRNDRLVARTVVLTILQPYQGKCKDCKSSTTQNNAKYCHGQLKVSPSIVRVLPFPIQVVPTRKVSARYAVNKFWTRHRMSCQASNIYRQAHATGAGPRLLWLHLANTPSSGFHLQLQRSTRSCFKSVTLRRRAARFRLSQPSIAGIRVVIRFIM